MIWSRKYIEEWFREPISPLMESFMPYLEPEANKVLKDRFCIVLPRPFIKTVNGYVYFGLDLILPLKQPQIFLSPVRLFRGLKKANKEWKDKILPLYKKEIAKLKQFDFKNASGKELLNYLEKILKFEAWIFTYSMYLGIHCIYSERLLRYIYRLLVRDKNWRNYVQLIRGYSNKTVEADQELWKLACLSGKPNFKKKLNLFIEEYGHRVLDIDVIQPTLAEDKALLENLIKIYSKVPASKNPAQLLAKAKKERANQEKLALKNLRGWIPFSQKIFKGILKFSQRYAALRETRPFYHLMAFSLARKTLLELGRRVTQLKKPEDIFYLTYQEIESLVKNDKIAEKEVKEKVKRRQILMEEQKKKQPAEFVKV